MAQQARRMTGGLSASEREELKDELRREVLGELQDSFHSSNDLDGIRDAIDERLETGAPRELDIDAIRGMSAEDINANWTEVQRVMSASGAAGPQSGEAPPSSNPHKLSWERLRAMPVEEHQRRRGEIDAWLGTQQTPTA